MYVGVSPYPQTSQFFATTLHKLSMAEAALREQVCVFFNRLNSTWMGSSPPNAGFILTVLSCHKLDITAYPWRLVFLARIYDKY